MRTHTTSYVARLFAGDLSAFGGPATDEAVAGYIRAEQMSLVMKSLAQEWLSLEVLIPERITRSEAVYWFLAILELLKGTLIEVIQTEQFGAIHIRAAAGGNKTELPETTSDKVDLKEASSDEVELPDATSDEAELAESISAEAEFVETTLREAEEK